MTVQIVEIAGAKMAVLPEEEFRRLAELAEDNADVAAAIRAEERRKAGEEYVPASLVNRIIDGESPLRVWREHRGFTQAQLAERTGLSQKTISLIEAGKRDPSSRNWRSLAEALAVDLEDIIPIDAPPA